MAEARRNPAPVLPAGERETSEPLVRRTQTSATRSPFEIAVDQVWRFFSSTRVAIGIISFLALLTLIGTLRGSDVPQMLADALPFLQGFVDRWYAWDVFGSWLFAVTLAVLAVSTLIGGMINRIPSIWRQVVSPTVPTTWSFLQKAAPSASLSSELSATELVEELKTELGRRRYRVLTAQKGDDIHIYADKNRWSKLATFPFHSALILVMIGALVASQLGFRDTEFIVPEGQTVPVGHGTDLSVHLDRFTDRYYLDGTAQDYRSDVTIFDGDDPVRSGTITVNDPLSYGDVTIYQTSFGETVNIRVKDRAGTVLHEGPVTMGLFISTVNPDAPAGQLVLDDVGITLNLIGPDENPWNQPELDNLKLGTEQLFVQVRSDAFAPGVMPSAVIDATTPANLGDVTVEFLGYGRFSLFQVARNPGIPIFIVAAIMLVASLAVTFYLPHRRIRAIVAPSPAGGAHARMAPLARRDWSGQRDFLQLVEGLKQKPTVEATVQA